MTVDCKVVIVVLFPLITNPCGPIHNVFTITGVSTTDGTVKTHDMFIEFPEYTELLSGTNEIVALGTGTVGRQNYNNSTLMINKTHSVQIQ